MNDRMASTVRHNELEESQYHWHVEHGFLMLEEDGMMRIFAITSAWNRSQTHIRVSVRYSCGIQEVMSNPRYLQKNNIGRKSRETS